MQLTTLDSLAALVTEIYGPKGDMLSWVELPAESDDGAE